MKKRASKRLGSADGVIQCASGTSASASTVMPASSRSSRAPARAKPGSPSPSSGSTRPPGNTYASAMNDAPRARRRRLARAAAPRSTPDAARRRPARSHRSGRAARSRREPVEQRAQIFRHLDRLKRVEVHARAGDVGATRLEPVLVAKADVAERRRAAPDLGHAQLDVERVAVAQRLPIINLDVHRRKTDAPLVEQQVVAQPVVVEEVLE